MTDLFGVGQRVGAPPLATTMISGFVLVIDTNIRCRGSYRGQDGAQRPCGRLLARRSARPHTHECSRCGYVNDSEDGSWAV